MTDKSLAASGAGSAALVFVYGPTGASVAGISIAGRTPCEWRNTVPLKLAAAMNVYGAPSAPTPAHEVTKLAVAHCGAALAAVGAPTTTVPASAATASNETIRDLSEIFIIRVPSQALLDACMLKVQQGPCLNQLSRRRTCHHQVSTCQLVQMFQPSNR